MSDALPLSPRPDLGQYKKLAKDLRKACQSGTITGWAAAWTDSLRRLTGTGIPPDLVERLWAQRKGKGCTLSEAQFFLARCHGFANWPKFAAHIEALAEAGSTVSLFERAADAIVNGEWAELRRLLDDNSELVRERSEREHRSTLLHYVSANGVEDFRQKTPPNIVEIGRLLLDRGAEVNAVSEAYGGGSTTLMLTATSWHPEQAGLQIPLLELLIERGAAIDAQGSGSTVTACLRNGRGQAAEFLASRGARLDLEGAAGVGRLDLVESLLEGEPDRRNAFAWACQFGRTAVAGFLLRHGVDIGARLPHNGQTGLHWAAYGGYPETVSLLLEHGASVTVRDGSFDGTPLDWALHAWREGRRGDYYGTVARLVRAGSVVEEVKTPDTRMLAALRGEADGG